MIPTRIHGAIDYGYAVLIILSPWLFGFADGGVAQGLMVVLGLATIGVSLLTDYELALRRLIPMPAHLAIDVAAGLLLVAAPWLFGFADRVWLPHVAFGAAALAVATLTQRRPASGRPSDRPASGRPSGRRAPRP